MGVQVMGTWAASGGFGEQWSCGVFLRAIPCPGAVSRVGSSHLPPRVAGCPLRAPLGQPVLTLLSASRCEMAAGSCRLLLFLLPWLVTASHSPPGCKIRITSKGLDLGKGLDGTLISGPG